MTATYLWQVKLTVGGSIRSLRIKADTGFDAMLWVDNKMEAEQAKYESMSEAECLGRFRSCAKSE